MNFIVSKKYRITVRAPHWKKAKTAVLSYTGRVRNHLRFSGTAMKDGQATIFSVNVPASWVYGKEVDDSHVFEPLRQMK